LVRQHLRWGIVPQNKFLRLREREKVAAGRMRVVGKNILKGSGPGEESKITALVPHVWFALK
jgi:hypothetical protein